MMAVAVAEDPMMAAAVAEDPQMAVAHRKKHHRTDAATDLSPRA